MDQSVDETVIKINNAINTMVEDRLAQYCATLTSEKITNELRRLSLENIELKDKLSIACEALENLIKYDSPPDYGNSKMAWDMCVNALANIKGVT